MGEDDRINDTAINGTPGTEETHSVVQADLAAYALGALDRSNCDRIERHLGECEQCRQTLFEYEGVLSLLPLGLPTAQPPAGTLSGLLKRLHEQVQGQDSTSTHARAYLKQSDVQMQIGRAHSGSKPGLMGLPAALRYALLVFVVLFGLLGWGLYLGSSGVRGFTLFSNEAEHNEEMMVTPLKGSSAAPTALGHLMIYHDEREGQLIVSGLPPLPPDRSYQLWFVAPDQTRVSGGVFRVDQHGQAMATVTVPQPLASFRRVGVTEEPLGGSPGPTGRNVLAGDLPPELLQP